MGLGIDLEAATAEPYHAMRADDTKPAACGRNRRGSCSASSAAITATVGGLAALAIFAAAVALTYRPEPSYSVELTGYEGIDPGRAARLVSPSFNVTLRMNNTCVDSARVAVTYSGVALGWARADPRDCAKGRWAKDVEVVARGGRVGLSQHLRERMASDWRSGELDLDVYVMMYRAGGFDADIPRTFDGKVKMMKEKEGHTNDDLARSAHRRSYI